MAMPNGLTLKQDRFVKALSDPNVKSQSEAARIAGYSARSDRSIASDLMTNANVVSVLTQEKPKRAGKRDKASSIFDHSANTIEAAVSGPDAHAGFALLAFKASADVLSTLPDEPDPVDYSAIRTRQRSRDAFKMLMGIRLMQRVGLDLALSLLSPRLPHHLRNVVNVEHEQVEPAGMIEQRAGGEQDPASEGEVP